MIIPLLESQDLSYDDELVFNPSGKPVLYRLVLHRSAFKGPERALPLTQCQTSCLRRGSLHSLIEYSFI